MTKIIIEKDADKSVSLMRATAPLAVSNMHIKTVCPWQYVYKNSENGYGPNLFSSSIRYMINDIDIDICCRHRFDEKLEYVVVYGTNDIDKYLKTPLDECIREHFSFSEAGVEVITSSNVIETLMKDPIIDGLRDVIKLGNLTLDQLLEEDEYELLDFLDKPVLRCDYRLYGKLSIDNNLFRLYEIRTDGLNDDIVELSKTMVVVNFGGYIFAMDTLYRGRDKLISPDDYSYEGVQLTIPEYMRYACNSICKIADKKEETN